MEKLTPNNDNFLSDLTDGRKKGKWKSFYDEEAQKEILWERNYLLILLCLAFLVLFFSSLFFSGCLFETKCNFTPFKPYIFGCIGGFLGGIIFSMKWLVHSVAKNLWNFDRRLWRVLTPILSLSVALFIVVLLNTNLLNSNVGSVATTYKSFGIGFLSGYFSDNAIGKMTELAQVLFGSNNSQKK